MSDAAKAIDATPMAKLFTAAIHKLGSLVDAGISKLSDGMDHVSNAVTAGASGLIPGIADLLPAGREAPEVTMKVGASARTMELQAAMAQDPSYEFHNTVVVPTVGAKGPSMGAGVMVG